MDTKFFLILAGIVLVLEGIPWFLSPVGVKKMMRELLTVSDGTLRLAGGGAMLLGVLGVWLGTR